MKFILIFLTILIGNSIGYCQGKWEYNDTIIVEPWYSRATSAEWNNWFVSNEIPENRKVIAYYDKDLKNKIFEGYFVNDSTGRKNNFKIYFLNGSIRETSEYNPTIKNDSSYVVRSYFKNGELKSEGFGGYYHYPKIGKRWEYAFNGKKILIEEIYYGKTIQYDIHNGDTLIFLNKDSLGSLHQTYYTYNQQTYKSKYPNYSKSVSYTPDQLHYLCINLDTNYYILQRRVSRVYRKNENSVISEKNKIDSLPYFKNLRSLTLSISNKDDLVYLLKKMSALPSFEHLKEIRLIGSGFEEIPKIIFRCENLESLELINTQITNVPKAIKRLKKLTYFQLSNEPNSNPPYFISNLTKVPNLQTLIMSWNYDMELPSDLLQLKHLKTIYLTKDDCLQDDYEFDPSSMPYDTIIQKSNFDLLGSMDSLINLKLCSGSSLSKYLIDHQLDNPNFNFDFFPVCFPRGTQIQMVDGTSKSIEAINVGDSILSYNEQLKSVDTSTVNQIHVNYIDLPQLVKISFSDPKSSLNGSVLATSEHPFWSDGKWINAMDLNVNQELTLYSNNFLIPVIIEKIEIVNSIENKVYNLNTTSHTFFANGIIVHNK